MPMYQCWGATSRSLDDLFGIHARLVAEEQGGAGTDEAAPLGLAQRGRIGAQRNWLLCGRGSVPPASKPFCLNSIPRSNRHDARGFVLHSSTTGIPVSPGSRRGRRLLTPRPGGTRIAGLRFNELSMT